jgi:hypothetical protein
MNRFLYELLPRFLDEATYASYIEVFSLPKHINNICREIHIHVRIVGAISSLRKDVNSIPPMIHKLNRDLGREYTSLAEADECEYITNRVEKPDRSYMIHPIYKMIGLLGRVFRANGNSDQIINSVNEYLDYCEQRIAVLRDR